MAKKRYNAKKGRSKVVTVTPTVTDTPMVKLEADTKRIPVIVEPRVIPGVVVVDYKGVRYARPEAQIVSVEVAVGKIALKVRGAKRTSAIPAQGRGLAKLERIDPKSGGGYTPVWVVRSGTAAGKAAGDGPIIDPPGFSTDRSSGPIIDPAGVRVTSRSHRRRR